MKGKVFSLFVHLFIIILFFSQLYSQNKNEERDKFINDLISQMTLEEKAGQMTQLTLEVLTKEGSERIPGEPQSLDMNKLREAILDFKVGSIINTGISANTIELWHEIIAQIQNVATKESRLSIPVLYGIDAIHGANYTVDATLFPQNIAMAATRNRELVRKSAEITAYEVRASGIPWNFNPVLGLARQPYWPRFWETFGEDTYLASELGVEYVNGSQGKDISDSTKVAACIKHYLGYSVPNNGKDRTPAWIPERMLREIFLPPFAEGVKSGAATVMLNSSEINGTPVHSDRHLITEILKEELGFEGFVVSDWEDVKRLHTRDRIASTPKEAVKLAVEAGLDMSMVPYDYSFATYLVELVNEGEVSEERVDDAVRRILKVKHDLGLFDNPYPNKNLIEGFASDEFTEVNKNAAREAITLLKNENSILPISKDTKILVTGPTADLMKVLNGGWTITWLGNIEELYPEEKNTFLEAVQNIADEDNVTYVEGTTFQENINIDEAVAQAEYSDVIFACLGEDTYCETNGNITNLQIPEVQLELVRSLAETGKPIVLVLFEGRPRVITCIADKVDAIVMGYLPGMEGGDAAAEVIFGDVNPSGKLPFTYPRDVAGYTTYDYKPIETASFPEVNPLWSFGHGLSYTTFEYSELILNNNYGINDEIVISVTVTNTGNMGGKETVELYITDLYASVSRPNKQLKGFEKIDLLPGESKKVKFTLSTDDLAFYNRENKRVVEPGEFVVSINDLKKQFTLH